MMSTPTTAKVIESESDQLRRVVRDAFGWTQLHTPGCAVSVYEDRPCDCGLAAWWQRAQTLLGKRW
jgi:hypothetical protein